MVIIVTMLSSVLTALSVFPSSAASYTWPVSTDYGITNGFYAYENHNGSDMACPIGTPVYAVADGTVTTAMDRGCLGSHRSGGTPQCSRGSSCDAWKNNGNNGSFGNYIYITHANGVVTRYCHLRTGFVVSSGQNVSQGQLIGYSGAAGNTTGPHLHFEFRINGTAKNPADYLTRINVDPNPVPNNFPGEEDTSWNVPVWVYANRWLETYDDWGNVESGRHIDEGDYCYVERVYRNGYVRVRYPSTASSDGYRWAYVQASGFSLSPKNCYADIGDKFYAVIKNAHYNNCVSRTDGTNQVYLQNSNGTSKQIWYFERQEDNAYVISSCLDGNVLEMTDGIRENITHITAHDSFWGGYYQQWYMIPCGNGYRMLSKHYTSEMWYLDRSNNGDYNGNRVQIYEEASNEDQVWIIDKDSANADLGNSFYAAMKNTQYGGYISKVNNTDKLYMQGNNNTSKQIWLFDRQNDGAYTISSCYDGTLMEMTNGVRENRTQISAAGSFWGGYCQQWYLIPYANGYKLLCKHYTSEGWYLDRSVNSDSNGNFVQIYEKYWDTRDQIWTIEKRDHVHTETIDNYIEASCTETGLTQGSHCSICGIVIVAQESIPRLDHDIEFIPERPATETETGLTAGKKCKLCGEWIEPQMVIPMQISKVTKGDTNGDTKVNMKDLVLLQQYLNNWDVTINEKAANVNGDEKINMKDLVLLQQYLNNWDVELK